MKSKIVLMAAFLLAAISGSVAQTKADAVKKTLNERYESAESDLKELISKDPSNGDLYFDAGDNYFYWGEIEEAEKMYRKGIEVAPANPLNYAGLGRVAWINNNTAVNSAQFAKAIEIMSARSNKISKPIQQLTYLKMAEVYLQSEKKDLPKALEYINIALGLGDANPEVYIQLGDYYSLRDGMNLSNAIMQYNKALEKDPKYTRALLRKGVLYVKVKSWDEGLNYYNEAISVDPNYAPAYREKAELLYKAGRYNPAIEAYAKYLELNNNCRVQQRYASFIFLTKDYKRAIDELERAKMCNPDNAIIHRLLGYSYYEAGDFPKGRQYMEQFFVMAEAKGKPTIVGSDYAYLGKLMTKSGQDSLALETLKMAVIKDTTYTEGYGDIAAVYFKQKKYDLAAQYYQLKVDKSEETAPIDFYYLGQARYFNKEYSLADASFEKAVVKYPDANFWRGRCNSKMELNPEMPEGLAKPYYQAYIAKVGVDPKAIEVNKKNLIESYSYLGFLHYTKKEMDCSKWAWSKVLELDTANEKAKAAMTDKDIAAAAGTCVVVEENK